MRKSKNEKKNPIKRVGKHMKMIIQFKGMLNTKSPSNLKNYWLKNRLEKVKQ